MGDEDKELVVAKPATIWQRLKDSLWGAIDKDVDHVGQSFENIREMLRPGLTQIAHQMNKPYVEPFLDVEFLERWKESEDMFSEVAEKYRKMLVSVPNRQFWKI